MALFKVKVKLGIMSNNKAVKGYGMDINSLPSLGINNGPMSTFNYGNDVSWFGKGGYMDNGSQALSALGNGLAAYTAYKQYGLAKDKFNFEKAAANRNVYNQSSLANSLMDRNARISLALASKELTPEQRNAYMSRTKSEHLSTAPIG